MSSIAAKKARHAPLSKNGKNTPLVAKGSKLRNSQKKEVLPEREAGDPLTFTREDWTQFRDIDRISAMAGVPRELLPRVLVKELVDNGFDVSENVEYGLLYAGPGEVSFFVQDDGPGISGDDASLGARFSICREMVSSKTKRMPTRGMLGNGLRVVVGVVLVGEGELKVSTRGRTLTLAPQMDGITRVVSIEPWDGQGTRIEITLRGSMAEIASPDDLFDWADEAKLLAKGPSYRGKSSPWWYSFGAFWELLQAAGEKPIERLIECMEGCSDRSKVVEVVGKLVGRSCNSLTKNESSTLLKSLRKDSKKVSPERLGKIGRRYDFFGYAKEVGTYTRDDAEIPFVVEAFANRAGEPGVTICVNRTPVVTEVQLQRLDGGDYGIFGVGLEHRLKAGQKRGGEFRLVVNVIAPFVPLISSGKDPDLAPMLLEVTRTCETAIRGARRTAPKDEKSNTSQKSIILRRVKEATARLSGGGTCLFSLRQMFYFIRPFLIHAIGKEPSYGTFGRIIGEFEDDEGDIEGLYRDDRGTLYHPHTGERIPLGTRSVANYERQEWAINKVLYCEKEGFFPILIHAKWPERHDCALLTSKGYATRAVRELLRIIAKSKEPVTIYCLHDGDGPGTMIFQSLARELEKHGIFVVNLGLDPAEAREMGLAPEPVTSGKTGRSGKATRIPVADYIPAEDEEWLQNFRIELNAMSTPQFLEFLDRKIGEHIRQQGIPSKVIPPNAVVKRQFEKDVEQEVTRRLTEEAVRVAKIPSRVKFALKASEVNLRARLRELTQNLPHELIGEPTKHWSNVVSSEAVEFAGEVLAD